MNYDNLFLTVQIILTNFGLSQQKQFNAHRGFTKYFIA
jgi:hypothetical protein